jgi:chromosome segregation protein
MKQLEAIGMVQFFLYERIDLDIARNTAFLGPNGTGKTALLDALQTVLLSADENMMNFNAAGEGTSRARRLREYCLGVYGQTEAERCRSAANTYINLVFRDTATGIPVTIGVSVSAFAETTDIVRNMYVLPGVALTTAAHVEALQGGETVVPWRRFMQVAADLCRQAGTTFWPTTNGAEFARRVYIEHLASPGERPNVRSIRAAFARSLKLNDKVTDLDEMLRKHLIEPRPTNVRQFRARLEQFRDVRALIRRIEERIKRAGAVADRYAVVQRERAAQANLMGLHAVYESERIAELLGEADERIETFEKQIEAAQIELSRATTDHDAADAARTRAIEALNRDPEFMKQAGQADRLKEQQEKLETADKGLNQVFDGLLALLAQSGRLPAMEGARGDFEHAIGLIDDMKRALQGHERPDPMAIQAMARAVARIHDVVRRELYNTLAEAKTAKERQGDARLAMERAQRGLSPVRQTTIRLQNVLREAGIETTPVCDLVTVSDARSKSARSMSTRA